MTPAEVMALRKSLGWTQEQMAQQLGVTWTSVQRWETSKVKPSPMAVRALEALAQQVAVRRAADAKRARAVSAAALSGKGE